MVALRIEVNSSSLATGLSLTMSMASPSFSLPADGPGSVTFWTVTASGYFRYPSAAYSALSSDCLKSPAFSLSMSSLLLSGGYTRSRGTSCSLPDIHSRSAWPSVRPSLWLTVVMLRWPDVGCTSVPLMSTTCFPSTSPRVLNVGPGPRPTNGTVTTDSSRPKTTTGTSATTSVKTRLFAPPITLHTLGLRFEFTLSVTHHPTPGTRGEYRCRYG